ncbi:sigma-54 interaction domain-containing protein [Desulforhopalus singaporensis]|uniref:PAS domain S-box-containing protein n=1 Tax=Desulforhopalus singaporensis TaxID=91360 RepID=A0A1H0M0V0_9BACT|nr:sigma 54-interacting transcriptional regulator [Desulforhopalus singaporensis]SDO73800.1 PAS domain S-box-containing protein [Desulforhopalus singaporensis]
MSDKKMLPDEVNEIILESISDGVFTVDHNWRITSFNRAAEEITGTPRKKAIGRFCWEVFRSNMCEGDCALKRTMKEGKSFVSSSTYIINSKQQKVPIGVSTSVLKDQSGEILGGVETFRDRTLVEELRRELSGSFEISRMVSRSPIMKKLFAILPQVAESDSTVLLEGETGTGKEFMSLALHRLSKRKKGPFMAINCGALPDTLLESELFGYKAGAFTGADKDKQGLFSAATSGTILLDEIGDTSSAFQVRLLRLLEEKEYQPLGSVEKFNTDARIIAATNSDLERMVEQGTFRKDLFYRINVIRFILPPLRERKEDIPLLTERFIAKMNQLHDRSVEGVTPAAMSLLLNHDYPGNIRELENIIEHGFVLCRGPEIDVAHLPASLGSKPTVSFPTPALVATTMEASLVEGEKEAIFAALKRNNFNRLAAARELGIHKSTLFRKIKKYKISLPATDGRSRRL